jgi:hypothetical protein
MFSTNWVSPSASDLSKISQPIEPRVGRPCSDSIIRASSTLSAATNTAEPPPSSV